MPRAQGGGGKAAAAEQRRLRQYCLAQGIFSVDLSSSPYDWRQLLKCLPEDKSRALVGPGVVEFSFRLLQGVKDHNYVKIDSGEKHVFEICGADGARWHLHFHKHGSLDKPFLFASPNLATGSTSSAAQPADQLNLPCTVDDILNLAKHPGTPVGRMEAAMAMDVLLEHYLPSSSTSGAVDITSTNVFPWHQWLRNIVRNREIVGPGIVKVYAFREAATADAEMAFLHPDGSATFVNPESRKKTFRLESGSTQLHQAPVATDSWLQLRTQS